MLRYCLRADLKIPWAVSVTWIRLVCLADKMECWGCSRVPDWTQAPTKFGGRDTSRVAADQCQYVNRYIIFLWGTEDALDYIQGISAFLLFLGWMLILVG